MDLTMVFLVKVEFIAMSLTGKTINLFESQSVRMAA